MKSRITRSIVAVTLAAATAVALSLAAAPAYAASTTYYVNNASGSGCSDSGAGTSTAQPWCSFTPVNTHGAFGPGDRILLASGDTWNQEMDLTGSGTSTAGITLDAYGSGANPRILRNQGPNDLGIKLVSPDYWTIQHLEVGQAAVGILVDYRTKNHTGLTIRSVNVHDNKGIMSGHDVNYPASGGTSDPWAAANDVNLAAGILVTATDSLSYSPGEYAAKNIAIDDIVGSHNLDSVAVTTEGNGSGTGGVDTFQNVTLSSLRLSTDDGNAAPAYQNAGIGCPDSLRIIESTNVIVRDSTLTDEAACHTATGTAAVFLARVDGVTFANNSFVGVPNTGSNDQTAIDFEYYEHNVVLRDNYFSANAGAAVEFLNIHNNTPTDQTQATLDGNSFSYNDIANTVSAASVHQLSGGGDASIPSGSIVNSLYSEPNRTFADGNLSGVTMSNNLSVNSSPIYAGDQFTSTQGANQWSYQSESTSGTWSNLPTYSATTGAGGAWQTSSQQYVAAYRMAPLANTGEVARVWTAPFPGTISIRGRVFKADINDGISAGNGVTALINKIAGGTTTQLWPASGGAQVVGGTDEFGYATNADSVTVNAGDQIRFEVGANGSDNSYDTASWSPSIAYTSSTTPYAWLFSTGLNFEGWSMANQVSGTVSGGTLNLTSTGGDPYIISQDNLGVTNPATTHYLHVSLRNETSDPTAKVYFTTTASPNFSEDKSVTFTTATNASGFTDYTVNMGSNANWTGTIKQLRLDPFSTTGVALVDSIRLQN